MKKKSKKRVKLPNIFTIEATVDAISHRLSAHDKNLEVTANLVQRMKDVESSNEIEEMQERLSEIEASNSMKGKTINMILDDAKRMMEQLHTQFGFMSSFIIGRCFLQAPAPEHNPSNQNHHRYFRATGSHPKTFEITGSAFIKTGSGIEIVPSATMREFFPGKVPIPISSEMFNQACSDMMNSVGKALPTALPSPNQ